METDRKELPPEELARRREFRAALALRGTTARQFARELGVSTNHLGMVLRRERESQRVAAAIDQLIAGAFE